MQRIGLIAGNGRFPHHFARAAQAQGIEVIVCAIREETEGDIEQLVGNGNCHWVQLGELGKLIGIFKSNRVEKVAMAGKVTKTKLFGNLTVDDRVRKILAHLPHQSDDALLKAIADELISEGMELLDSTLFLKRLLVERGELTTQKPSEKQLLDVRFGFMIAKRIASLDIGQTVVVKDRAVLALEAIEGTDGCIKRGSHLGNGGVVVVKVSKPNQDMRFDIPVIGPKTISHLIECHAAILALEADKVLFLERERCLDEANRAGLIIVALPCDHEVGE